MTLDLLRLKAERVAKGLSQDEMARKWVGKPEHLMPKEKMVLLILA